MSIITRAEKKFCTQVIRQAERDMARLEREPASGSSATIERSQPPSTLTVILQDAGQTLRSYIGDVIEDGTRTGQVIVHARGVV